ncbi:ANTAR domain protein [compost metagenome]
MLQSFLLIDEFHTARLSYPASMPYREKQETASLQAEPIAATILKNMGFRVQTISTFKEISLTANKADAVLLSVSPEQVELWRKKVLAIRSLPILWWCDKQTFPSHACKVDPGIDGMIGPEMSSLEIHCSLLLSVNHYFQRTEWAQEREQLLSRLEERKWIDQAKRILSEIKHISEAEAYEFLRKQAMNERKRMSDVATSIVKVYQLLLDDPKGGRKR